MICNECVILLFDWAAKAVSMAIVVVNRTEIIIEMEVLSQTSNSKVEIICCK